MGVRGEKENAEKGVGRWLGTGVFLRPPLAPLPLLSSSCRPSPAARTIAICCSGGVRGARSGPPSSPRHLLPLLGGFVRFLPGAPLGSR